MGFYPFFEVSMWAYHNFVDSDRRQKTLGPGMKDFNTTQSEDWTSCKTTIALCTPKPLGSDMQDIVNTVNFLSQWGSLRLGKINVIMDC